MNTTSIMTSSIDNAAAQVVDALARDRRVMIVGAPAGSFHRLPVNDKRFIHYPSTETTERAASRFNIPPNVGLVIFTKQVGINLNRQIFEQASANAVPLVGPLNSPGSVDRIIAKTFELLAPATPPPPTPPIIRLASSPAPSQVDRRVTFDHGHPVAVEPQPERRLLSDAEIAVLKVFEEIEAGIALAKETAMAALAKAEEAKLEAQAARRDAEKNASAVATLDAFKQLLSGGAK